MLTARLVKIIIFLLFIPQAAFALQMPTNGNELADMAGLSAQSYIVADNKSGETLIAKNPNLSWPAASLSKLVTALVVLDSKTKLTKTVALTAQDQILGQCQTGGACIRAKAGVRFSVDGLFHAALMPSANNAALALARSTGLAADVFAERMNEKAASLGALASHFNEPTGLDPNNVITASDYAKIVNAAFSKAYLRKIAGLKKYTLRSASNFRYNQIIKNTDKLLGDADIEIVGAKTGYLDESQYNFAALLKQRGQNELVVVVLGAQHLYSAFEETKQLAGLAELARNLSQANQDVKVLEASTTIPSIINN